MATCLKFTTEHPQAMSNTYNLPAASLEKKNVMQLNGTWFIEIESQAGPRHQEIYITHLDSMRTVPSNGSRTLLP